LLKNSGLDFPKLRSTQAIPQAVFAERLLTSGLVCEDITWVSFHGGMDFGYLLKLVSGEDLPDN